MTEDELEEIIELEDVGYDQRIVKLMKFLGIEDLSTVQNIKIQRQFDIHSNEYIREQVVLGFTRIVGHADEVVLTEDYLSMVPKFYAKKGFYEEKTEFEKAEIDDKIKAYM